MTEKYLKRTQKGKDKTLKEQRKKIKELILENPNRNFINRILVHSLILILNENDKKKE